MAKVPVKKWPYVEITWEDACFFEGSHDSRHFVEDYKPCIRKTIGLLIHENEDRYFVAGTQEHPTLEDEKEDCTEVNVIPKRMALQKKILRSRSKR